MTELENVPRSGVRGSGTHKGGGIRPRRDNHIIRHARESIPAVDAQDPIFDNWFLVEEHNRSPCPVRLRRKFPLAVVVVTGPQEW